MILVFLFLIFLYIFLCHYFRFYRLKSLLLKYNHVQLDYQQAQDIVLKSSLYDMTYTITTSLSFALFRTYAIPTVSHLLVQTNQLIQMHTAGRRAEDTGILLGECLFHKLDSYRDRMGLARINYLHNLYKNHINNDDMLYTLSLFILEPIRWIKKYEWRSLSSIEEQARFIYYKELGIRMGIKNIPLTLIDIETWTEKYEAKNMIYTKDNQLCGEATLILMIRQFPKCMHNIIRKALLVFVDERLRLAMDFEEAPAWMEYLIKYLFKIRAFILLHFALPRLYPNDYGQGPNSCPMNKYGRYQRTNYFFEPWYVKPSYWKKIYSFLRSEPSVDYRSQGFKVEELGPEIFAGKGLEFMKQNVEQMKERVIEKE